MGDRVLPWIFVRASIFTSVAHLALMPFISCSINWHPFLSYLVEINLCPTAIARLRVEKINYPIPATFITLFPLIAKFTRLRHPSAAMRAIEFATIQINVVFFVNLAIAFDFLAHLRSSFLAVCVVVFADFTTFFLLTT